MIILGDSQFDNIQIYKISTKEAIETTPNNSLLYIQSCDIQLQQYCKKNLLPYAVFAKTSKEAIYANNLAAKYIFCTKQKAIIFQKIAENYMFDAKILLIIVGEEDLEWAIENFIDGVIYANIL